MKRLILLLFGAATILLSCEATQKKDANATTGSGEVTTANSPSATAPEAQQISGEPIVAAETGTRPTLNPAHGEPYHRCDIEVGAPLNSAPASQNAVPPVAQQAPASGGFNTNPISPSGAPAPSVSSSAAVGPKPALNPAHGEPHHRCDLQVGAPLI